MRRKPKNARRRFSGNNNAAKAKSASANRDKYLNLARDAMATGDRIEAENYLQHADHYFRVYSALMAEDARYRAEQQQAAAANPGHHQDVAAEGDDATAVDAEMDAAEDAEEDQLEMA